MSFVLISIIGLLVTSMEFNKHPNLEGKHAYLSPSNYHWLNYDDEKFDRVFRNQLAKERGVKLHDLACQCIKLGVRLPDNGETLSLYVNHAIDFGMMPEQVLYYSENCFGTADTIGYIPGLLRIHDLKTGEHKAYMHQLEIYSAIYFLEYEPFGIHLGNTDIILRIYQSNNYWEHTPDKGVIKSIMDNIIAKDQRIRMLKES